mmetsp:Transcript_173495/g.556467  ORF Transcript_173495/g.556467 Transcript_173495/m.556467 type:complete len:110 (+) Transcript_173495:230-559(+)
MGLMATSGLTVRLEQTVNCGDADGVPRTCVVGGAMNLHCQSLLPLYGTRLLRGYVELEPRLPVLVAAVRHWARAASLEGEQSRGSARGMVVFSSRTACAVWPSDAGQWG